MQQHDSTPDGVCTADLALEFDCVNLEMATGTHLRESIAGCTSITMLSQTCSSIDMALAELHDRKKQAETKIHALSFAAELIA